MAIQISGTTVINDSRNITDVENFGNSDTVYTGSGANLTGIQAGSASFTASGAISNGAAVIVNTDGTVSEPTVSAVEPPTNGTAKAFTSSTFNYLSSAFDRTTGKVVFVYQDVGNSSKGTAIVGTVSGTSISFGNPVVFNNGNTQYIDVVSIGDGKVVVVYRDAGNSNKATAAVGTISGDSISFNSETIYNSGAGNWNSVTYDSTNDKIVVAYTDTTNSSQGYAIVGTVSGASISFGTKTRFETGTAIEMSATYDSSNGKVVIAYLDNGNSDKGTAVVGTVSGTSISFGTPVIFNNSTTENVAATYDPSNSKVVIAYTDNGNSWYGTAIVGTVSGTSISFGSEVVFESASSSEISAVYDSAIEKVIIAYRDEGNSSYGTVIAGTVSGTSISFGSAAVFESASSHQIQTAFDAWNNKVVIGYRDGGNSNYPTAVVVTSSTSDLTSDNFIGIAAAAISNSASGSVTIVGGINASQSSLSVARKYYVQADGTLGTDGTSVLAGISISGTQISVGA